MAKQKLTKIDTNFRKFGKKNSENRIRNIFNRIIVAIKANVPRISRKILISSVKNKYNTYPWPGLFLQKIKQKKIMKSNFYSLPIFFSARNCSIVGYFQIFGGINQIQWSPAIFSIPPFITFGPWKQTIFIEQWSKTAKLSR